MVEIRQTDVFAAWFRALRDHRARARIQVRIDRLQLGLPGDVKPVGEAFRNCESTMVPVIASISRDVGSSGLSCWPAGDKRTQGRDIKKAIQLASDL